MDIYANLPRAIADKMKATRAAREAAGFNVYFINERGEYDSYSMRDAGSAERFRESLVRRRLTVFADKAESEAHKAAIGESN